MNQPSHIDLGFPIRGETLPVDHGFALYAALSHRLPTLHQARWLAVHPIGGRPLGEKLLALGRGSTMTLRVPVQRIADVLPLGGAVLEVLGARLALGAPNVRVLDAAPSLDARMVAIKLTKVPEKGDGSLDVVAMSSRFEAEARRQLAALGIDKPLALTGRRSMAVHSRRIVGFSVRVMSLDPSESLRLQAEGLGGKRAMGCGVFRPTRVGGAA